MKKTDQPIMALRKTGRCRSGAEADGGVLYHAVPADEYGDMRNRWGKALCGTKPGDRGNGWGSWPAETVTCPKCLKRQEG